MRKTKHLIVLSLDAMGSTDFELLTSLPNTKNLLQESAYCSNVSSIYPSLTYPSHTSILTGCYPNKHGIVRNTLLQPWRTKPDWFWHHSSIKVPTLVDYALQQGMKVASLLWPVLGKSKVKYNMPEVFANRPWQTQLSVSLCNGSPCYLYKMNKLFGKLRQGLKQPELDNFVHESAKYTLHHYRPDLMLVHFCDLDFKKHHYGCTSSERADAIRLLDKRIGEFVTLMKEDGIYEDSTLILLGDHSQLDAHSTIHLNELLRRNGLLEVKDGQIKNYQAIAKSCDGSAYIYCKNKNDIQVISLLKEITQQFAEETNAIAQIFTAEEAAKLGADPTCALMLEASQGFYFLDEVGRELICDIDRKAVHEYSHALIGVHGYLPTKPDYQTIFIARGAGIRQGIKVKEMGLIDEGPTFAALLGLEMKDTDGRVLEEILL